jgi:SAM-dependent methyltransferase
LKLHLGCGSVYLKDYINVDSNPDFLKENSPTEIFEKNLTTLDKYYKYKFCKGTGVCVADIKGDIYSLPFGCNKVDEIVLLHVFEHIPLYNVRGVLNEFNRVLKKGGRFYIAVPDIKETAGLLYNAKTPEEEDWAIRLIHGTQRNKYLHHFCGYTFRSLTSLLSNYGFEKFNLLPNINFYPAIHVEAFKG